MTPKDVFEGAMAIILIMSFAGAMGLLLFMNFQAWRSPPLKKKKKEKNDAQR
jgi:hypothetical protein